MENNFNLKNFLSENTLLKETSGYVDVANPDLDFYIVTPKDLKDYAHELNMAVRNQGGEVVKGEKVILYFLDNMLEDIKEAIYSSQFYKSHPQKTTLSKAAE